jgi:GrpB-like predicted nucleotidyltransferase (UPF0157 family)
MSDIVRFSNAPHVFASADRLFKEVAWKLAHVIPAAEIHHIGSTAIPGTLTKGDLDVLVRVSAEDFRVAEAALERMFRRNTGSFRSEAFAAFLDHSTEPDLGVQLVVRDGEADTFLVWRERLESDPELRRQYDDLKRRFEGKSMDEYREAKAQFISERLRGV